MSSKLLLRSLELELLSIGEVPDEKAHLDMATFLFPRSLRPSTSPWETAVSVCQACRRNKSSFRRQRKALRIKPDPTFLPSKTEPSDHIIFNPPSSAPNVYHTPLIFLPKSDPRSRLQRPASTSTPSSPSSSASPIDPFAPIGSSLSKETHLRPTRPQYEKKYHLKPEQIAEIRKLRAEDPRQWTRVRLAEKFECSQFFVSLCCSAPPQIKEKQTLELEEIKRKWGRRKTEAREDRQTRKALWGRDA